MIDFINKKIAIPVIILAIIIIIYFLSGIFGKTDDWKYTPTSAEQWLIFGGVAGGILILLWLIISIYLIAKGKLDQNGVNVGRRLGIWLLVTPLILIGLGFLLLFMKFELAILSVPILALIFIIVGIVYAVKKHVKIALIPLILLPIVVIGIGGFGFFGVMSSPKSLATSFMMADAGENLGFAVGGAKDISNFRKNIENDYLPLPTDITYEGLYYEYFFDTGDTTVCEKLFCPSYSYSLSKDPFSKEDEYYLQVGLNSGIKESDFQRKKLNLVIVLDISGSMGSSFNRYYYDQFGNREQLEEEADEDAGKSKMEIASKSVVSLLDHLNEDDRFGMVLFDNDAYLANSLSLVGDTDMNAIKGHILELQARGGTNMGAGMTKGTKQFKDYLDINHEEYENRVIFLTDAMPNRGETSEGGLLGMTGQNSDNKVYTTFIGVGVDFNTELVEAITKIRGANYYSVHSAKEFKTRMDDEFEYMVTPLVFNLLLQLDASGFDIEKVYGSPEVNEATGEIMKVNTLFPSKREGEETKGGIVILKLKKTGVGDTLTLKTSYEDRGGNLDGDDINIELPSVSADHYDNRGIRKGILLARYVNVMRNWIDYERSIYQKNDTKIAPINNISGILIPEEVNITLGRWERQSIPLKVSNEHKEIIEEFNSYFKEESQAIGDLTLSKEIEIMNKLIG